MFGQNFLKAIIESIQVYGLSLEKFKRIIHYLLASKFNSNEFFYVNALLDQRNADIDQEALINDENDFYFQELIEKLSKSNKLIEDFDNCIDTTKKYLKDNQITYNSDEMKTILCQFYRKKIKFFKAYELIEDVMVSINETHNYADMAVFKHCFLLNLLS
jgi:dsDNA-specific endonuclease/ATPase MutS2